MLPAFYNSLGIQVEKYRGSETAPVLQEHQLLSILGVLLQQSTDGQRNALVLGDIGNLNLDNLSLGQNILGLADTAVRNLGDVNQAIHTGQDLGKGTKGHQLDDLGIHNITPALCWRTARTPSNSDP